MAERALSLATRVVRVGVGQDPRTGAISTPVYQSATFQHPGLGESTGYDYSRSANPTRAALEAGLADLEGGTRGLAFASGMAAITNCLLLFRPGDHLVASEDLYGGTYRLLTTVFARYGLEVSYVDTTDLESVARAVGRQTRAILIETPSNPLLRVTDLAGISGIARQAGALTIVDNTFLSPYLQLPLALGADIVLHSATKYLAGHNDVVAGAIVSRDPDLGEQLAKLQNAAGAVLGPNDAWLVMRGMKTLALRMERHQSNARMLALWLQRHPLVEQVYYPGLPDHPGQKLNARQADGPGGMLSFSLRNAELVPALLRGLRVILFAESLGGVETLITHPARQTHADMPEALRERLGINERLLRLSVGIEDPHDLIADLDQALARAGWEGGVRA